MFNGFCSKLSLQELMQLAMLQETHQTQLICPQFIDFCSYQWKTRKNKTFF